MIKYQMPWKNQSLYTSHICLLPSVCLQCQMQMWQRDQTSNWNIKEHFPQHEEGTNITSSKYIYASAFTEGGPLYCTNVKVGLLSKNEVAVGTYRNVVFMTYVAYRMDW